MRRGVLILAALTIAMGLARLSSAVIVPLLTVRVPEEFALGKATLPAGEYTIEETDLRAASLIVRNTATGKAEMVPYITRLAPKNGDEAAVVFDQVGKAITLSEVYVGGEVDGYLVAATSGPHKHVVVKGTRKKS